jgi:hypothetical protein
MARHRSISGMCSRGRPGAAIPGGMLSCQVGWRSCQPGEPPRVRPAGMMNKLVTDLVYAGEDRHLQRIQSQAGAQLGQRPASRRSCGRTDH